MENEINQLRLKLNRQQSQNGSDVTNLHKQISEHRVEKSQKANDLADLQHKLSSE
jgi:hypothetical protein